LPVDAVTFDGRSRVAARPGAASPVALGRGATLVTGHRKHDERLSGLVLEDWLRPCSGNQLD